KSVPRRQPLAKTQVGPAPNSSRLSSRSGTGLHRRLPIGARLERELVGGGLLAVDGHVAVVDLEDHRGHRRVKQAAAARGPAIGAEEPASFLMAGFFLSFNQGVAHL